MGELIINKKQKRKFNVKVVRNFFRKINYDDDDDDGDDDKYEYE